MKTAAFNRIPYPAASLVLLLVLAMVSGYGADSAPARKPVVTVDPEAIAFVQEVLAQRPEKEFAVAGILHRRHSDGKRTQIPVQYSVHLDDQVWQSIYTTEPTAALGSEKLVVTHRANQPNEYQLTQTSLDGSQTNSKILVGDEAAGLALAGTDFWLSDLGMEFLHWPEQRLIRDAKITMKWGRPLKVVESVNPRPGPGRYSRVVSWIDSELGSLARAEAYDQRGKRFKVFELKGFTKVNGRWEVKELVIRNDDADSRTHLEFQFQSE